MSSEINSIIQICVTHFCIIDIISACQNCSCFPNGSLSVYLPELLRGAVRAVIDYVRPILVPNKWLYEGKVICLKSKMILILMTMWRHENTKTGVGVHYFSQIFGTTSKFATTRWNSALIRESMRLASPALMASTSLSVSFTME